MTHKTKAIILRILKYGETSLVVTAFTHLFGVQTYMVNGVRTSSKKGSKAALYQPGAILNMVVYHNEQKSMQRIREAEWAFLYQTVFSDIIKNSITLYIVELINKCLKQPEQHTEFFDFCEDVLLHLDAASDSSTANLPLFFALQVPHFLGIQLQDNFSPTHTYLDLKEGCFVESQPLHPHFLSAENAETVALLLKVMHPSELTSIPLHHETRRNLLLQLENYYRLQIQDFGKLKSLQVLHEVLAP